MKRSKVAIIILALALLFALATGFSLLYRFAYVLIMALAVALFWSWWNLRWLDVTAERRTTRTQVGQWAEERLWARNKSPLPKSWLEIMDKSDLPGHHTATVISLPGRAFRSWMVRTDCRQRGRFALGPINIVSEDPFGLFRLERNLGNTHNLLVYPKTVELPRLFLPPNDLPGDSSLQKRTHHITPNASGVREYLYGDSYNRIHWRSTARMGKLMVKEFDAEPSSEIWLILDMDKKVHAGSGEESTEEYGVTIAASIAKRYLDANFSVGLITYGNDQIALPAERGPAQLNKMMDSLALIRAMGAISLDQVLITESNRFGRHTTVVIITPSSRQEWVLAMRHLAQRKARLVVIMVEASSFGGVDGTGSIVETLGDASVPSLLVRRGEDISKALTSSESAGLSGSSRTMRELLAKG